MSELDELIKKKLLLEKELEEVIRKIRAIIYAS
jgi:hypothetical protein